MKIAVIGAGAMGSLFGAMLNRLEETNVWLLDIWQEHVTRVERHGLEIQSSEGTRLEKLRGASSPLDVPASDLAIVFVKSSHTADAAKTAESLLVPDGVALTLQNGMGNAEILAEVVGADRVLAGTTAHGSTMLGPGLIRHAGQGPTVIGPWSEAGMQKAKEIARLFNDAAIETQVVEDVRSVIWGKLLVNVGINAITALTNIKNGQLVDLDVTKDLSRAAVEEAAGVARALGVKVRDDAVEHVYSVAEATGGNRSSMGQDVDNKRFTEIDAINGAVVREAEKLGMDVPVNRTLTALIKTLEGHY